MEKFIDIDYVSQTGKEGKQKEEKKTMILFLEVMLIHWIQIKRLGLDIEFEE